jgi:uridine kinase
MRNIIPFINTTDYIINSAMPYELAIYKHKLFDQFERWAEEYLEDPLRNDAYMRADRIYQVLQEISPIQDDSIVPVDSVLREFIGGSCYEY